MEIQTTDLPGVMLVHLDVFQDPRGVFFELHHARRYAEAGIRGPFVQDNVSRSIRGTLRGLHYQLHRPQGKLITVLDGVVYDVAVDIRKSSATFGKWVGVQLSSEKPSQLYIPPGFAHGFCALSPMVLLSYKCTELYDPSDDRGIVWNDPALKIAWPMTQPLLSDKDRSYKSVKDMMDALPD